MNLKTIFFYSTLLCNGIYARNLEKSLRNLNSALQRLQIRLETVPEGSAQSNVIEFDNPTQKTCGAQYKSDGTIIIKRKKKDKLLCVLRGYRPFYFEKWNSSDENMLNSLAEDYSFENFNIFKVVRFESLTYQAPGVTVTRSFGKDVPKYLIIWPKNNTNIEGKIRILLFEIVNQKPINKYFIQKLLDHNESDIKQFYNIKYPGDEKKFNSDKQNAIELKNEAEKSDFSLSKPLKNDFKLWPFPFGSKIPFELQPGQESSYSITTERASKLRLCHQNQDEREKNMIDVFNKKRMVYFGYFFDDQTLYNRLKTQYENNLSFIIQSDYLILYYANDAHSIKNAQILANAVQQGIENDYLYQKLQGFDENTIKNFYKHCKYDNKKFNQDKQSAELFINTQR